MISFAIKDLYSFWYLLALFGFLFLVLFLTGMERSGTDNYRVMIFIAKKLHDEISNSNLILKVLISDKLYRLIQNIEATKNPTVLNTWVVRIEHYKKIARRLQI